MVRIRYMLVDHHCSHDGLLHIADGRAQHVPSFHRHVPVYHWARMDDNTIFVKATYYELNHKKLLDMPGVTLLHASFSRQTIATAIREQNNPHHHAALLQHPFPYHLGSLTPDLVDWIVVHHGTIFDHER